MGSSVTDYGLLRTLSTAEIRKCSQRAIVLHSHHPDASEIIVAYVGQRSRIRSDERAIVLVYRNDINRPVLIGARYGD